MSTIHDLGTAEGVIAHLADTPYASDTVTRLSGGNANYVYRLHLRTPFEGRTTLVLKHAKPYLPTDRNFAFDVARQAYEVEALRRVHASLPSDAVVTVPAVHSFDRAAHAIIMDDAGEGAPTLKQLLIERPPSAALAATIGAALGAFMGALDAWGPRDAAMLAFFARNAEGKRLSALITYGRLVATLAGACGIPALDDPPLGVPADKLDAVGALSTRRTEEMATARAAFVMGDLWPGNMLVRLGAAEDGAVRLERVFVVDWEVAKAGVLGLDIGQFCAEISSVRRFHPPSSAAAERVLVEFLKGYFALVDEGQRAERARVILGHFGAHLVAWTPRVPWGDAPTTREAVLRGVDCLVKSHRGAEDLSEQVLIEHFLRQR